MKNILKSHISYTVAFLPFPDVPKVRNCWSLYLPPCLQRKGEVGLRVSSQALGLGLLSQWPPLPSNAMACSRAQTRIL